MPTTTRDRQYVSALGASTAAALGFGIAAPMLRGRARKVAIGASVAAASLAAVGAYGRWMEPRWLDTTRTRLAWPGPPLRIAFLTDVHAGWGPRSALDRAVTIANEARPDVVLLGGDYIAGDAWSDEAGHALAPLCRLVAPHGVFGVFGNHDVEHDEKPARRLEAVRARLHALGVRVLENESRRIVPGVVLVALGSHRAGRDDVDAAFDGVPPDEAVILLAHNPSSVDEACDRRFHVALAGHTHGGQACVPATGICPPLADDMRTHPRGLERLATGAWLYVSRGLGTSGAKARFGSRPEVAIVDLHRG